LDEWDLGGLGGEEASHEVVVMRSREGEGRRRDHEGDVGSSGKAEEEEKTSVDEGSYGTSPGRLRGSGRNGARELRAQIGMTG